MARMEDRRGEYRILVVKREGLILLGRSVRRWGDNIEMYLEEMDCIDLAHKGSSDELL